MLLHTTLRTSQGLRLISIQEKVLWMISRGLLENMGRGKKYTHTQIDNMDQKQRGLSRSLAAGPSATPDGSASSHLHYQSNSLVWSVLLLRADPSHTSSLRLGPRASELRAGAIHFKSQRHPSLVGESDC